MRDGTELVSSTALPQRSFLLVNKKSSLDCGRVRRPKPGGFPVLRGEMDTSPFLTKKLCPVGNHPQRKMSFSKGILLRNQTRQSRALSPVVNSQQNMNSIVFLDYFLSDIALFSIFLPFFFLCGIVSDFGFLLVLFVCMYIYVYFFVLFLFVLSFCFVCFVLLNDEKESMELEGWEKSGGQLRETVIRIY